MRELARRLCCLLTALVCVALLAAPSTTVARADDGELTPISWTQLGLSNKLVLLGLTPTEVSVPVPEGISPTVLTGILGSAVNTNGRIDVLDARGLLLGSIPTPPDAIAVPFVVDISAAQIASGAAKLTFVIRDDGVRRIDSCTQPPTTTLSQLATNYSAAMPNPRTIADYLPGYLHRISIQIGPNPTSGQQQAALSLVADLTHLYRPIPVLVDVDTTAEPAPPALPDSRVIRIIDARQPGLVVRDGGTPSAVLEISGNGAELLHQIDLFADRRILLAQTSSAAVTSVTNDEVTKASRTMSFAQLGMTGQTSVLGTSTLYSGFDASAFAVGAIQGATVHLIAHYTPVVGGEGSLLVRVGSDVVATQTLDKTGTVDMSFDVPGQAIASNTGLALDLQYVPRQECAPSSDRLAFVLDPDSTVTVDPGAGNRGGFPVLPMALTPEFNVALGNSAQIGYAASAINLMGMQSTVPLHPTVRPFDEAVKSGVPLLVVADAGQLAKSGLKPTLVPGAANSVEVNGNPITAVDLNGPLGIIQAFTDGGRPVVAVSGSTDWALVGRAFDYIRGLDDQWASLSGDVVATGAENTTVNLTIREGGPMAARPAPGEGWMWWGWLTVGVAAVAAIAVGLVLILRRRRHGDI